jgi:phage terminase large subunit
MDTLPKLLHICFPDLPLQWNRTDYLITLPNGSEVWIGGVGNEKEVEKILGKEYSTIYFNECSQLSYSAVQLVLTRLAEKSALTKKVYYDENPPSKKHWSYWQFIKKLNPTENEPLEDPDDYACMRLNPTDNIDNIDPTYLKTLKALSSKEKARFLFGEFTDADDGQVYYEFKREEHVSESAIKLAGTIFIGMDFNVDPMTAVLFQIRDNKFVVFDEIYLRNSDTPKMCKTIKDMGLAGAKIIPDSTGRNRKTSGKSDFIIIEEHFGKGCIQSTQNPFVVDRVNNVNRLLSQNRIIINPKCKKLINDLEQVAWRDNKLDQTGDAKLLTHISDCLGYGCWKLDPMTKPLPQVSSYSR